MSNKKYIFFTPRICYMGGAENYINSKKHWLEKQGWSVNVVYYNDGPIYLTGIKDNSYGVKEIHYPTFYYSRKRRNCIADRIASMLQDKDYQQIIIESSCLTLSLWAELVSKRIGAKHLYYDLQEVHSFSHPMIEDFVNFKFYRHELAGIGLNSVSEIMKCCGLIVPEGYEYQLTAYSNRPVEDYDYPLVDTIYNTPHDYIIGSIGRLEKPFLILNLMELLSYIRADHSHKYILLLIGGCLPEYNDGKVIERMCAEVSNLKLFITGFICPIPAKLIEICDMYFSCAGSVVVSSNSGVPTVAIDVTDFKTMGVYGYTTKNALNRINEETLPLSVYLNEILKEHKYQKVNPKPITPVSYESHFEYLGKSAVDNDYYDINKIDWPQKKSIPKYLMPILGPDIYLKIRNYVLGKKNS